MPTKPSIWEFLPQPERDHIPPRERQDRQVWPGYWIYHNRDDSISFGAEQRDYFGWLPAEITRAVREAVINTIASMVCHAHRMGKEAYDYLKQIRSRADKRAGLAVLSNGRLAKDDFSSTPTHDTAQVMMPSRDARCIPTVSRFPILCFASSVNHTLTKCKLTSRSQVHSPSNHCRPLRSKIKTRSFSAGDGLLRCLPTSRSSTCGASAWSQFSRSPGVTRGNAMASQNKSA